MLNILSSSDVPDSTYFRTGDVEPILEGEILTTFSGEGNRRSSWGRPGVNSREILHAEDLVAIHVGFFHKHGGGQFWRYYRFDGSAWQETSWAKLSDEDRQRILIAYEDRAPDWVKSPGKLRKDYKHAELQTQQSYKIVRVIDGRYHSAYDEDVEYVLGKRLAERAVDDHGGGYYSHPDRDVVMRKFAHHSLLPENCYIPGARFALLLCEISGTIIEYDNGKLASTYIRPIKALEEFEYMPVETKVS